MNSLDSNQRLKFSLSLTAVLLSIPIYVISTLLPTNLARDSWYYATIYVARSIQHTGHIPDPNFSINLLGRSVLYFWGAVGTDTTKPLEAITYATFSTLLGIDLHWLWILSPVYVITFIFYCRIINVFVRKYLAFPFAALGAIMPVGAVINTLMLGSVIASVYLFGIYLLLRDYDNPAKTAPDRIFTIVGISAVGIFCYLFNPILWGILAATVFLLLLASKSLWGRRVRGSLLPVSIVLSYPIVDLLISSNYGARLIGSIMLLMNGTGKSAESPASLLPAEPLGLAAALVILPFGVVGGIMILRRSWEGIRVKDRSTNAELVLVAWGIGILIVMISHISSGSYFLIIRSYTLAIPLVIISAPVGLKIICNRIDISKILIILIISGLLTGIFILQASTPHQNINTYNYGASEYSGWTQKYASGLVLSDMSAGSPLVANGYTSVAYPANETDLQAFMYTSSGDKFCKYVNYRNTEYIVLTDEMKQAGFFIPDFSRRPISEDSYRLRADLTNGLYDNGEYVVTTPSKVC